MQQCERYCKMIKKLLIASVAIIMAAPSPMADRRQYVWTYQYMTVPQGASELEFYQTTKLDKTDSWEYRIEIEQGLTDKTDFAIYQIFSQKEGDKFAWDAFQFRVRHRLATSGEFFPLIVNALLVFLGVPLSGE